MSTQTECSKAGAAQPTDRFEPAETGGGPSGVVVFVPLFGRGRRRSPAGGRCAPVRLFVCLFARSFVCLLVCLRVCSCLGCRPAVRCSSVLCCAVLCCAVPPQEALALLTHIEARDFDVRETCRPLEYPQYPRQPCAYPRAPRAAAVPQWGRPDPFGRSQLTSACLAGTAGGAADAAGGALAAQREAPRPPVSE